MFDSIYQDNDQGIEIFSPSGKLPGQGWKITSNIHRVYDRTVKGFVYLIDKPINSFMTIPENNKLTLGLKQRYLIIQLRYNQSKTITFEIVILDKQQQRHRFHISTKFKNIDIKVFHVQIPFNVNCEDNYWINYILDLKMLCEIYFHVDYKTIDSITIQPSCRLRKIFTLPNLNLSPDFICPSTFDFPSGTAVYSQIIPEQKTETTIENLVPMKNSPRLINTNNINNTNNTNRITSNIDDKKEIEKKDEIIENEEKIENIIKEESQGKSIKSALTHLHKKSSDRIKNKQFNQKPISLDKNENNYHNYEEKEKEEKEEKLIPNIDKIIQIDESDHDLIELLNPSKLESYQRPKTPTRAAPKSPNYINNLQQQQQQQNYQHQDYQHQDYSDIPIPIPIQPSSRPNSQQNQFHNISDNFISFPIPPPSISRPNTQQNIYSDTLLTQSRPSTSKSIILSRPNTQQNDFSNIPLQSSISLPNKESQNDIIIINEPYELNDETLEQINNMTIEEADEQIKSIKNILEELESSYISEYGQIEYSKIK